MKNKPESRKIEDLTREELEQVFEEQQNKLLYTYPPSNKIKQEHEHVPFNTALSNAFIVGIRKMGLTLQRSKDKLSGAFNQSFADPIIPLLFNFGKSIREFSNNNHLIESKTTPNLHLGLYYNDLCEQYYIYQSCIASEIKIYLYDTEDTVNLSELYSEQYLFENICYELLTKIFGGELFDILIDMRNNIDLVTVAQDYIANFVLNPKQAGICFISESRKEAKDYYKIVSRMNKGSFNYFYDANINLFYNYDPLVEFIEGFDISEIKSNFDAIVYLMIFNLVILSFNNNIAKLQVKAKHNELL